MRLGMQRYRSATLGLMTALVSFGFVEVSSYILDVFLARRGVLYRPPRTASYTEYLSKRDPELGWPAPSSFGRDGQRDRSGSRVTPSFPDPDDLSCVSVYGDSFTWSADLDHEHAWPNLLSRLLGCRVANFGVGGYGSDQAYLRFRSNPGDSAPVVMLNHLSENILRNVNQFRGLLYPSDSTDFSFKPRFVLGERGELRLVPLPTFKASEVDGVIDRPERYLEHEFFEPGGASGLQRLSFPFSLAALRSFRHFHVQARLRGLPWYADFYAEAHPSRALQITERILASFCEEARRRRQTPIVTVIPTGLDLIYFRAKKEWVYRPLLEHLHGTGCVALDLGPRLLARIGDRDPCSLFAVCSGHYNEEGYALLAAVVKEFLLELGLLPQALPRED